MKYLFGFIFLFFFSGCPIDVVQPPTNPLQLTVEDATCTEAFLRISLAGGETNRTVTLKRGDSSIATITMAGNDSLFVDEGLLPKKSYAYTLTTQNFTATTQATTMDTTSSNWSFTLDTLGESGSYLVDVTIVNDTIAYAVGEIHIGDSLYNAAKWNGKKWEPIKILFYTICGQENRTSYPTSSVIAFGSTDIWFSMNGSQIARWNGNSQTATMCLPVSFSINKLWGQSTNSVYAVGYNGTEGIILYYNGTSWQKQESGTSQYLVDIDGNSKGLYASGINISRDAGVVLRQNQGVWEKIIDGVSEGTGFIPNQLFKSQLYGSTDGLWIDKTGTLYTVGNYMYRYKLGQWNYMKSLPENHIGGQLGYRGYLQDVGGNDQNDLFIVGQRGTVRHFNGRSWTQVGIPFNYNDDLHFWYSVAVKGDLTIVVGSMDHRARIMVLKR